MHVKLTKFYDFRLIKTLLLVPAKHASIKPEDCIVADTDLPYFDLHAFN